MGGNLRKFRNRVVLVKFSKKNKTKRRLKKPWFDQSSYLMEMIVFFPDRRTFMLILTQKR